MCIEPDSRSIRIDLESLGSRGEVGGSVILLMVEWFRAGEGSTRDTLPFCRLRGMKHLEQDEER